MARKGAITSGSLLKNTDFDAPKIAMLSMVTVAEQRLG